MIIEARPGGLTSQEIADNLGVGVNVISGRPTELLKNGYVIDSGKRRKTRSGLNARVVVAARLAEPTQQPGLFN
jgi:predicted transcriptional regulator